MAAAAERGLGPGVGIGWRASIAGLLADLSDVAHLGATRRALLLKRAGAAAEAWPLLAASLGARWSDAFVRHAEGREPAGALRDGWDLARELRERGELGPAADVELAERDVVLRYDGRSAPRRRLLPAARRAGGGLVVGALGRTWRRSPGTNGPLGQ